LELGAGTRPKCAPKCFPATIDPTKDSTMPRPLAACTLILAPLVLVLLSLHGGAARGADRPNVLFIAVDDLRPELHCYGKSLIHSPNIDRLASGGLLFERSYCMVPTCGASRASLMSGIRPAPNRFVNYLAWAQRDAPGKTTLNTHFKNNGYYTLSLGKIFHHPADNANGWSEPAWRPKGVMTYHLPENAELHRKRAKSANRRSRGPAFESAEAADASYADGQLALKAVAELRKLDARKQPFFLAVGFFKPHLPFIAPKKYWDLYDTKDIQLAKNYNVPQNAPKESIHNSGELRAYAGIPAKGRVSDETARKLIHGYYACVSFTDAQVGKLLDELDRLGIADNTIVVLWGDHGWNLSEHTLWCKHSCYETSMHAPLIVRAPGVAGGKRTKGLTEFIDIYPSLCELAGLSKPSHLQGRSFAPLLKDPELTWKSAAVGRFRNGDTIRTDQHRFTEYSSNRDVVANMLYDHRTDPIEDKNIAGAPANRDTLRTLEKMLRERKGKPNKSKTNAKR
jgi:arylsulfatase A-like enzyme